MATIRSQPIDIAPFAASSDALVEIQLCPPGNVRNENRPFVMDEEVFQEIYAEWKKVGRELVIDYEHQTLPDHNTRPDGKAPAAGWITDLKWDDSKGIIGLVKWNADAREEIRSGQYKYLSPVFSIPKGSFRPTKLWSAAVTNDPAIHGMAALAANRRNAMSKKKTATPFAARLLGKSVYDRIVAFEPDEMPGELDEGTGGLEEKLNGLKEWLVNAGKCSPDADPMSVLESAANALAGMKAEPPPELAIANTARKELAEKLALKADASFPDIVKKVEATITERVPATELTALKAQLDEIRGREALRHRDELVERFKKAGKLLESDETQMAWAMKKALDDPADFEATMNALPIRVDTRVVMTGRNAPPKGDERTSLIRKAASEYKSAPRQAFSMRNVVNGELVAHNMPLATDEEIAAAEKN